MASVNIWLNEKYKKKDGSCAVYVYTYIHRKKVRFNTGVSVLPEHWNDEKKKIKGSSKKAKDKNLIISNCVARINDIFVRYRLQNRELTPEKLRKEFKTPSTYIDFFDFLQREIEEQKKHKGPGTIDVYNSLQTKLKGYKKNIMFADIDNAFLDGFESHMKRKLKNKPNTIHKTLRTFRTFLNIAKQKKVIDHNPFDTKKMKRGHADRVYLVDHEVQNLLDKYRKKWLLPYHENQHKVLGYFLFSCFTGLRISDIRRLQIEDITNNTIIMQPHKTRGISKIVKIPLSKPALEILNDHTGEHQIKGPVFRTYCDQVTNRILKDLMDLFEIKKNITFHCGRHTFATMYLRKTKDLAGLQKLLGHYSINDTMKYAHVMDDDVRDSIKVFNDF
jgi:integrase